MAFAPYSSRSVGYCYLIISCSHYITCAMWYFFWIYLYRDFIEGSPLGVLMYCMELISSICWGNRWKLKSMAPVSFKAYSKLMNSWNERLKCIISLYHVLRCFTISMILKKLVLVQLCRKIIWIFIVLFISLFYSLIFFVHMFESLSINLIGQWKIT